MLHCIRQKFVIDKNIRHTIKTCCRIDFVGWGVLGGGAGGILVGVFLSLQKKAGTAFAFSIEVLADLTHGE